MTVAASDFRGNFPAFKDQAKFTDTQVAFYLTLAYRLMDPTRWGDLLDMGAQLYAAHHLSLEAEAQALAASGQGPGAVRGAVTSMSAAGVSWSRDAASAMRPGDGHWNLTQYGLRWRDLVCIVGAGPVQVGVPGADEIMLSQGPWPGVI